MHVEYTVLLIYVNSNKKQIKKTLPLPPRKKTQKDKTKTLSWIPILSFQSQIPILQHASSIFYQNHWERFK